MTKAYFESLELNEGDFIWILNEYGNGFWGKYLGKYDTSNYSFLFKNHSNGLEETIEIEKLQRTRIKGLKKSKKEQT